MTCVADCDDAMASVDVARVMQLRAVLWSMRNLIATGRNEPRASKAFLFELHTLADAGVSLADSVVDEAMHAEAT